MSSHNKQIKSNSKHQVRELRYVTASALWDQSSDIDCCRQLSILDAFLHVSATSCKNPFHNGFNGFMYSVYSALKPCVGVVFMMS